MFEVKISSTARKTSKKLPDFNKHRIVELLLVLRENPVPAEQYDIKKLGGCRDTFRARIGDIRIIYQINWNQQTITILVIKPRERAYLKVLT